MLWECDKVTGMDVWSPVPFGDFTLLFHGRTPKWIWHNLADQPTHSQLTGCNREHNSRPFEAWWYGFLTYGRDGVNVPAVSLGLPAHGTGLIVNPFSGTWIFYWYSNVYFDNEDKTNGDLHTTGILIWIYGSAISHQYNAEPADSLIELWHYQDRAAPLDSLHFFEKMDKLNGC